MLTQMMTLLLAGCAKTFSPTVIPETEVLQQERDRARGPDETRGIESVETLGLLDLQSEFEALSAPRVFRLRRLTLDPDASVAMHQHDQRPGVAYILSGQINEHRDGQSITRHAGEWAFEQTGVTHGWHNHSDASVQALVFDIISPAPDTSAQPLPEQRPFTDVPTENQALSIDSTASIRLDNEDPAFAGQLLRLRVLSIEPNGVVGAHAHGARPGFVYVLEGELNEHRGDGDSTYRQGDVVTEPGEPSHWWKNTTQQPVTLLLVDITDSPSRINSQ